MSDPDDHRDLRSFWKIYVPLWFGKIVAKNIQAMHAMGYFEKFDPKDFDHGHLLFKRDASVQYRTVASFLSDVVMILYHTREDARSWPSERKKGIPAYQRVQRSIIGYLDGQVIPAYRVVDFSRLEKNAWENYDEYGTISHWTLNEYFGLHQMYVDFRMEIEGMIAQPSIEFYIKPKTDGRFSLNGQKYDIYLKVNKDDDHIARKYAGK